MWMCKVTSCCWSYCDCNERFNSLSLSCLVYQGFWIFQLQGWGLAVQSRTSLFLHVLAIQWVVSLILRVSRSCFTRSSQIYFAPGPTTSEIQCTDPKYPSCTEHYIAKPSQLACLDNFWDIFDVYLREKRLWGQFLQIWHWDHVEARIKIKLFIETYQKVNMIIIGRIYQLHTKQPNILTIHLKYNAASSSFSVVTCLCGSSVQKLQNVFIKSFNFVFCKCFSYIKMLSNLATFQKIISLSDIY